MTDLEYLEQAEAHSDEGPLGEPAARDILKIALRQARENIALREALAQLEGKARLGGDCLGNSGPKFEPCQRSFYMLADIARAALNQGGE